jgi:hypothetical protein
MKTTIPERIAIIKSALGISTDTEFGRLCGMAKAVVGQLKTGTVKTIAARYAYKLEENTGFCAKWIQLGEGPMKLDLDIKQAIKIMESMSESRRKDAVKIIAPLAEPDSNNGGSETDTQKRQTHQ